MKTLRYVMTVIAGLTIGFAVRAAMRAEVAVIGEAKPKPITAPSLNRQPNRLAKAIRLTNRTADVQRSPRANAELRATIFDLSSDELTTLFDTMLGSDSSLDRAALGALFSAWGEAAPRQALAAVARLPFSHRAAAKRTILNAWVLIDTDAAFDYVNVGQPKKRGQHILDSRDAALWNQLGSVYPERAMDRAAKLSDPEERRQREDWIIRNLSYADPEGALEWLEANRASSDDKAEAMGGILRGWASTRPREALQYLLDLGPELQSREAFARMGAAMNTVAVEEVVSEIPEKYVDAFWGGRVEAVASIDPPRAAEMVAVLQEGQTKRSAYYRIASQWAFKDLAGVSEWVSSLPRSKSRDHAIAAFAHQLMSNDPRAGVAWFADMDQESMRSGHLHNALLDWLRRDETAATTWLRSQSQERIPQEFQAKVLAEHAGEASP